jgi:hypothetical protein
MWSLPCHLEKSMFHVRIKIRSCAWLCAWGICEKSENLIDFIHPPCFVRLATIYIQHSPKTHNAKIQFTCGLLLLILIYYFYSFFNGNFWEEMKAKARAIDYLQQKYKITVKVVGVDYSFKNDNYIVRFSLINDPSVIYNVTTQKKSSGEVIYRDNYFDASDSAKKK